MPSSVIGALAVGRQSAKDTVATAFQYIPATSIGLNINQAVQTLPAEVGGSHFLRGSFKASASGSGDCSLVVRPNSIGALLYGLTGQDTVTPVPGQVGAYSHAFQPFLPAAGIDLPWLTCIKDIAKLSAEQYLNTKVRSLNFDIPKSALVTSSASFFSLVPSAIAVPSSETFDTSTSFQTAVGSVSLIGEVSGVAISANTNHLERVSVGFTNALSEDEFSVGNYYPDNSTLLQRTVSVNADIIIRDTALYQAVYFNGLSLPNSWQPSLFRVGLTVTLTSSTNIPGTTQPYQLTFTFPGLDCMMLPITLSGADLVRSSLSTQLTLGPSGADTFTVTLVNGIASY